MDMSESYHDEATDRILSEVKSGGTGLSPNTWVIVYVALAFAGLFLIQKVFKGAN